MLAENCGNRLNIYVPDYVVFDLETTGLSSKYDEVVEISAIKVVGGAIADEFSTLVNPRQPIPYHATRVNGITDDMVAEAPGFQTALTSFLEFTGDMVLVGHNIQRFDMPFMWRDTMKYFGRNIGNDYADTCSLARVVFPELSCFQLTYLADYLGLSTEGAHRALQDCRMTQVLYERIGEEMRTRGAAGELALCPKCGSPLKRRSGMYGEFWGCMNYPKCRYTRNM